MKSCGRKWLGGRPILSSVPSSRRACGTRRVGMSDIVDIDGIRTLEDMSREELLEILLDDAKNWLAHDLSLIHISEPTRRTPISYAVFCLKKKKNKQTISTTIYNQ